jgi:hypothetical protein
MSHPMDSNRGRFYSKRVGDKMIEYAWLQREDVFDALLELSRLSRTLWTRSAQRIDQDELLADLLELWSASLHYSSATMVNFAAFVGGLGMDIKKGKTDSLYPHRVVEFDRVLTSPPVLISCWQLGRPRTTQLDPDQVTFWQSYVNMGSANWDVVFDLSGTPPGDEKSGTYRLEIDVGDVYDEPFVTYVYLDPHPVGI